MYGDEEGDEGDEADEGEGGNEAEGDVTTAGSRVK
jgi:hypothetical protein